MDRVVTYIGAIPLETDILNTNRNAMVGLAKLAAAMLGTGTSVNGLFVTPTSPASLQVNVAPGEIYSLQNLDGTAYSSLAADTAHQIIKQGILLNRATLNCPAPGTAGQSINYLIEATYADTDGTPVTLPYYNASNPSVAWSGPNNSGTQQNTVRAGTVVLVAKAGVAATTGTQTTPATDTGYVALCVVTVANGQTQITASSIGLLSGVPLIPSQGIVGNIRGSRVIVTSNTTLSAAQSGQLILLGSGSYTVALPDPLALNPGSVGLAYFFAVSGGGTLTLTTPTGAFYGGGLANASSVQFTQGMSGIAVCDGVNWVLVSLTNGATYVAQNGYQKLSSGLIMQWGLSPPIGASTRASITLPITFPNNFFHVICQFADGTATTRTVGGNAYPDSMSTFSAYNPDSSTPSQYRYFAIGN